LRHPATRISVINYDIPAVIESVRAGQADVGLLPLPSVQRESVRGLGAVGLGVDELVVVESSTYPFSTGQQLAVSELAGLPFVNLTASPDLSVLKRDLIPYGI